SLLFGSMMAFASGDASGDESAGEAGKDLTVTEAVYGGETVTGAVYDESGAWMTTVPGASWVTVTDGVTLIGNDATGVYAPEQFTNEAFEFIFNAETEDAWPAITLRLQQVDMPIWNNGNGGDLVAFKPDVIEFQRFGGLEAKGKLFETIPNAGILKSGRTEG